ncbi:MAG: lactate racemase domain-containing protein, partial [Promethearchaeota archaeon]
MVSVKLLTGMWCGDSTLMLNFPDKWNISIYKSRDAEALDESEIERALSEPIGTKPIEELSSGKKNVVIVVDDLSRPTPAHQVIPHILRKLKSGGIKDEAIKFVIGIGLHRPLTKEEMKKKIGPNVVEKYEVYNHNAFGGDLKGFGNFNDGTPIYINKIVANSELRIGISGVIPHSGTGFGGGAKLICPGTAGYITILYNHLLYSGRGRGILENDIRNNLEEIIRYIGWDFMVNIVLTSKREIGGLYTGDVIESYRLAANFAREIYHTVIPQNEIKTTDIVIMNAYPQDHDPLQIQKSMWPFKIYKNALKIVIDPASDGIFYHGLNFQRDYKIFLRMKANETNSVNI